MPVETPPIDLDAPYSPSKTPAASTPSPLVTAGTMGPLPRVFNTQLMTLAPNNDISEIRAIGDPNVRLAALVWRPVRDLSIVSENPTPNRDGVINLAAQETVLQEITNTLEANANPNLVISWEKSSQTLLQTITSSGHVDAAVIAVLVQHGADPDFDLRENDGISSPKARMQLLRDLEAPRIEPMTVGVKQLSRYAQEMQAWFKQLNPQDMGKKPYKEAKKRMLAAVDNAVEAKGNLARSTANLAAYDASLVAMATFAGTPMKEQLAQWQANPDAVATTPVTVPAEAVTAVVVEKVADPEETEKNDRSTIERFFDNIFGSNEKEEKKPESPADTPISDASDILPLPAIFAAGKQRAEIRRS